MPMAKMEMCKLQRDKLRMTIGSSSPSSALYVTEALKKTPLTDALHRGVRPG
jgi:hypothetical protein